MKKEISLLYNLIKVKELEERYGNSSCLLYPKEYNKIEKLNAEILRQSEEISKNIEGVSEKGILKVYDNIAKDVRIVHELSAEEMMQCLEERVIEFDVMDLHQFLEIYVLEGNENEIFSRLFWFSDIETRTEFLKDNFLCDLDIYFTRFLDYLVLFEVNEEALEQFKNERTAA